MSENKIYFKFDGKTYGGNEGDTIASVILRNGKLVGEVLNIIDLEEYT